MLLRSLGFNEGTADDDAVAILVGPNGSGKSNYLRKIALKYANGRDVYIVCNAAHDRFVGLRRAKRISAGRSDQSAKALIKHAMSKALDMARSDFYQISALMEGCGFEPRFGFDPVLNLNNWPPQDRPPPELEELGIRTEEQLRDFEEAVNFLQGSRIGEIIWIDASASAFEFSRGQDFAAVLRAEGALRKAGLLKEVGVYLQKEGGAAFEVKQASSGELSLISSFIFLITIVGQNAIVLIDEPENSLHPSWQREYVAKVFAALTYRNFSVIIATHAPLIVTGAITRYRDLVSVYALEDGAPRRLDLSDRSSGFGIEEVLWRAFDIVTPANHFVSEEIVEAINQYERGERSREDVLAFVNSLSEHSFDEKQKAFFTAVRALIGEAGTEPAALGAEGNDD